MKSIAYLLALVLGAIVWMVSTLFARSPKKLESWCACCVAPRTASTPSCKGRGRGRMSAGEEMERESQNRLVSYTNV